VVGDPGTTEAGVASFWYFCASLAAVGDPGTTDAGVASFSVTRRCCLNCESVQCK